jgi:hypothetical protein
MAVLIWMHRKTKAEALAEVKAAIEESSYGGSVEWDGDKAAVRVGPLASILHVQGEVNDDAVIIDRCSGALGGLVLNRIHEILERLFPGGDQA